MTADHKVEKIAHATLGASGAKRWMSCPASVRLSAGLPNTSGTAAKHGTAAHEIAEWSLKNLTKPVEMNLGLMIDVEGEIFEVDQEMITAVEEYRAAVVSRMKSKEAKLVVEAKFSLEDQIGRKDMFGTTDALIIDSGIPKACMYVIDFKYGKGVVVDPEENAQLMFYALGAGGALMERVELVVVQPRAPHPDGAVRSWRTTGERLRAFAKELKAAAEAADDPKSEAIPGPHCQFARCVRNCPAKAASAAKEAQLVFGDKKEGVGFHPPAVKDMTSDQLGAVYNHKAEILSWLKEIEGETMDRMNAGKEVPGCKMVQKRALRRWIGDQLDVADALLMFGLDEKDIYTQPKLKSPAQIEKVKDGKYAAEGLTEKPDGGYGLAVDTDTRPALPPKATTVFDPVKA